MYTAHTPVLLNEVLEIFDPRPGETYVDATVNGGGHALAILEKVGSGGRVVGIDWDCGLIEKLKAKSARENLKLICDNYANLRNIFRKHNLGAARGVLFDLGFSLYHVASSRRGFTFQKPEPLDMRYHPASSGTNSKTAADIVNTYSKPELEKILKEYGEERFSNRIAEGICEERKRHKILTTEQLVEVIGRAVPRRYLESRIHFATRTFQALRTAVNRELENIDKGVGEAIALLEPGAKAIVISFHSLEDRIVKNIFKNRERSGKVRLLTKKPIHPSAEEISRNPRARSAILRAVEIIK